MTWFNRSLTVACPHEHAGVGQACDALYSGDAPVYRMVCDARLDAAEQAGKAPKPSPGRSHNYTFGNHPKHRGPAGRGAYACDKCAVWMSPVGKGAVYSRDSGATWTPGPDACPVGKHTKGERT